MISLTITCSLLDSRAGKTSFTVLSTSTPPTKRKHFLEGSTSFRVSITKLNKTKTNDWSSHLKMQSVGQFYLVNRKKITQRKRNICYIPMLIDIHLQLCSLRSHTALFLTHSLKCCHDLAYKTRYIDLDKHVTLF